MAGVGQSVGTGATVGGTIGSVVPGVGTAIGAGAGALVGLGIGAAQYLKGKQIEKNNVRPPYVIPPEVFQNLTAAQHAELQGLPEEQKQAFVENQQQQMAYGLGQIGTRKGGLAGLEGLVAQQNKGFQNLLGQDAAARMQNKAALTQQRQNVADYRGQEFQFNSLNPYYAAQANAQGLMNSGMQNTMTGLGNVGYAAGRAYDNRSGSQTPATQANTPSQAGLNPYQNSLGLDSSSMFQSQPNNNYGANTGSFMNPNTSNMFQSQPANFGSGLNVQPSLFR